MVKREKKNETTISVGQLLLDGCLYSYREPVSSSGGTKRKTKISVGQLLVDGCLYSYRELVSSSGG